MHVPKNSELLEDDDDDDKLTFSSPISDPLFC
jgi:hypothetical protein